MRPVRIIIFLSTFFSISFVASSPCQAEDSSGFFAFLKSSTDTILDNQSLMNGRIWRNAYFFIEGNQFLLSDDFLKGSVCMHANLFSDIKLKYDIFNDELLTPISDGGTLQLNKEMVDSFYFAFQNKTYRFIRLRNDSIHMSDLFFHVLYRGNSSLYARYIKKIDKLSVGGSNERFYQINTLYFVKDDHLYQINGKRDLMRIMSVKKAMIRAFIRNNKIDISDKNPESFIPVIRYFDSLSQKPDL